MYYILCRAYDEIVFYTMYIYFITLSILFDKNTDITDICFNMMCMCQVLLWYLFLVLKIINTIFIT